MRDTDLFEETERHLNANSEFFCGGFSSSQLRTRCRSNSAGLRVAPMQGSISGGGSKGKERSPSL